MKWIDKLERRFGHIAIHDLMMIVVIGQAVVFLAEFFMPGLGIWSKLSLYMPAVLQGEVWRLLTFIFVPSSSTPLSLVLTLYLMWLIGHTLEQSWGDFRFNVYYFLGVLGAILAAAVTGWGTTYYLNLSLFFAFAMLYPEMRLLLFFIIPVKVKWLALFSGVLCLFGFVFGTWADRLSVLFSLLNFLRRFLAHGKAGTALCEEPPRLAQCGQEQLALSAISGPKKFFCPKSNFAQAA